MIYDKDTWAQYLADYNEPRKMWFRLLKIFPSLSIPDVSKLVSGGLDMVWEMGKHYISLTVYLDGVSMWFYRNQETNRFDGETILRDDDVSDKFVALLSMCI